MARIDRKVFFTLFFIMFVNLTGVGIVVPLLPVYAHGLGAGGFAIGLIFGAFSLSRTVCLPIFGRLSDRRGRKPFILAGLMGYSLVSIAFIWSADVFSLIAIRFIQGMASAMLMPVVQAYVGDITPEGSEGFSMGSFNMSVFFGLSLGPIIGGVVKDHFSMNTAFGCMGAMALTGFFLCLAILPPASSEQTVLRQTLPPGWKHLLMDWHIAGLFVFRFAYTAGIGLIWAFMPVLADTEFSISSGAIGVLAMLGVFISGLMQTPMGWLSDRIDRRMMVLCGGMITGLSLLGFQWVGGFAGLFIVIAIFGVGGGIAMPALMAMAVTKGHQTDGMGSVMALMTMAHSSGMLFGSLYAGWMMEFFQLRYAFSFSSLIMAAGLCGFFLLTRSAKKE